MCVCGGGDLMYVESGCVYRKGGCDGMFVSEFEARADASRSSHL